MEPDYWFGFDPAYGGNVIRYRLWPEPENITITICKVKEDAPSGNGPPD